VGCWVCLVYWGGRARMSRFSTIDSHHSASRDLERQRLERLMGQLRRDIEVKGGGSGGGASARRFQPAERSKKEGLRPSAKLAAPSALPARPGADAELIDRAPSAEMAWLLRAQGRMDQAASEVEAFLARHGLEGFASLLADGPGTPGESLEALQAADEAMLEAAGLPASPRQRLLRALEEEGRAASAPSGGGSPQRAAQPDDPSTRWRCLGRAPPGWRLCAPGLQRPATGLLRSNGPVVMVDAATGDAPVSIEQDEEQQPRVQLAAAPKEVAPRPPSAPLSSRAFRRTSTSEALVLVGPGSRPGSQAGSRPGTASGLEKACCYQCFRQVYAENAFKLDLDDEAAGSALGAQKPGPRIFCSEACTERFRQAFSERQRREGELRNLREQAGQLCLSDAPETGTEASCGNTPV